MPTASPIIEDRAVVLELRSMNAVIAVTPVRPIATPMTAVSSGRPAATSEPKVSSRITSAMASPTASAAPPPKAKAWEPEPLASTVRPDSRAVSMAAVRSSIVVCSTLVGESTSRSKAMTPARPSAESGDSAWLSSRATAGSVPFSWARERAASSWASARSTGLPSWGLASGSVETWGSADRSSTRVEMALW